MSQSIPFLATTDEFEDTMLGPTQTGRYITFSVSTNPFLYELATLTPSGVPLWQGTNIPSNPVQGAGFTGPPYPMGIRFKSAISGKPAVVQATLFDSSDPQPIAGIVLTDQFIAGGGVNPTGTLEIGQIIQMAGGNPNTNKYLFCDGSSYLKTAWPLLDAYLSAVGYPYGSDATHFQVPDIRDRVIVGTGGNTALAQNEGLVSALRFWTRHKHEIPVVSGSGGVNGVINGGQVSTQFIGASNNDPQDGSSYLGLSNYIVASN